MSNRKHSRDYDDADDPDNRLDFIHVGTEMMQRQGHSRQSKKYRSTGAQSKEETEATEWKPAIPFVSSRGRRAERLALRPEDFMDAQDLADLDNNNAVVREEADQQVGRTLVDYTSGLNRVSRAAGWHGADYGVDIASLLDNGIGAEVLPRTLATLFRRRGLPKPSKAAPARTTADKNNNKKKKRKRNVLSFSAAFGDDDDELDNDKDDDTSKTHYTNINRSSTSTGCRFLPGPNDSQAPSALEALASSSSSSIRLEPGLDTKRRVFGMFVLSGLLESETTAGSTNTHGGPSVPAGFTGQHRPLQSRWDAVPATGSQSQLHRYTGPESKDKKGGGSALLVTAADRAKLRIVDDDFVERGGSSSGHAVPDTASSQASSFSALAGRKDNNDGARETSGKTVQTTHPNTTMLSRFVKASQPDGGEGGGGSSDATASSEPAELSGSSVKRTKPARTVVDWAPSLLLCKRMGVQPPSTAAKAAPVPHAAQQTKSARKRAADFIEWNQYSDDSGGTAGLPIDVAVTAVSEQKAAVVAERPDMSLFEAIFG
ncbi:hypothetical protein IWW48_003624 [Coemansia sp. RSA 1200]|nr:hypothetical protein IWW48_003624 [Coemansia sp. RSA 1200]